MTEDHETAPKSPRRAPAKAAGSNENVVDLLGRLTSQGAHLAQEQVALMQAEVREGVGEIKQAIGAYAGAAVLGLAGLGVNLTGLGWWLGESIANIPLGIIIVGAVTLVVAAILFSSAKSKVTAANLKPERTIRTVEDTPEILSGTANSTGVNS